MLLCNKKVLCIFYNNNPVLIDLDHIYHLQNPCDVEELKSGCETSIKYADNTLYKGKMKKCKYHGLGSLEKSGKGFKARWKYGVKSQEESLAGKTVNQKFVLGAIAQDIESREVARVVDKDNEDDADLGDTVAEKKMFEFPDNESYDGYVVEGNKKHGKGVYTYKDSSQYIGEFKQNQRHGVALWINAKGEKELSVWEKDERMIGNIKVDCAFNRNALKNGEEKVRLEFNDGSSYEGDWYEFKKHGDGSLTAVLDSGAKVIYNGRFSHDKKHGKGG